MITDRITASIFFVSCGIKFRAFHFRGTYFSRVFNFANFFQSRNSRKLVLAKISKNKVVNIWREVWARAWEEYTQEISLFLSRTFPRARAATRRNSAELAPYIYNSWLIEN